MAEAQPGGKLTRVDEHAVVIQAEQMAVWDSLTRVVERSFSGTGVPLVAGLLGCAERRGDGPRPLAMGSTVPGFRVAAAEAGQMLGLLGDHRFSHYALVFRIDVLPHGATKLRAETRAVFPGVSGRVYRALVIGTGGHVLVTRRLLRAVKRRSERLDVV